MLWPTRVWSRLRRSSRGDGGVSTHHLSRCSVRPSVSVRVCVRLTVLLSLSPRGLVRLVRLVSMFGLLHRWSARVRQPHQNPPSLLL